MGPDGTPFSAEIKTVTSPENSNGFWGVINLSYKADRHVAESVYAIPVRAPPLVRKNRFGLLTISETIGGMNGTYRITYLLPTRQGLIAIGGAELGRDNGKYADVSIAFPAWTGRADSAQLSAVAHSIMSKKNSIVGTNKGESFDNAILVFVVGFLVKDVWKSSPSFLADLTGEINDVVDSAVANLIRRKLIGGEISLCDEDQFDVFVCRAGKKTLSLCTAGRDAPDALQYRIGTFRDIELRLARSFPGGGLQDSSSVSFENGPYSYVVQYADGSWRGVTIKKNGVSLSRLQCASEGMEPYLLPRS